MDILYENEIALEIHNEKTIEKTFEDMVQGFKEKLVNNNFIEKSIETEKYFGEGMGIVSARNKLLKNKIIMRDWLDFSGDFKGLYIFLH